MERRWYERASDPSFASDCGCEHLTAQGECKVMLDSEIGEDEEGSPVFEYRPDGCSKEGICLLSAPERWCQDYSRSKAGDTP